MKHILSIQSHVAYGYVGNRAAVFPLQRMGFDVSAVHTVQFSNHTGYGSWSGDVFDPEHVCRVIHGLHNLGVLGRVDALLTGYAGSPEICAIILETLDLLPSGTPWICDPVMGDMDRGFFVHGGIPVFFKTHASARAGILTPNLFELEVLTDTKISTTEDARSACQLLHDRGVNTVLVTSLVTQDTPPHTISLLASHQDGRVFMVSTPQFDLSPAPNGAGDFTAAVFAGHLLKGESLEDALGATAASIYGLFEATHMAGARELALIAAQDEIVAPRHHFIVRQLQ